MSGLCFGDQVLCEFLPAQDSGRGLLSAEITQSGNVRMAKGGVDNPPLAIGECLWTVEPVHQNCAFRELSSHMIAVKEAQSDLNRAIKNSRISAGESGGEFAVHADKDAEICRKRLKKKHKLTIQLRQALVQEIRFNNKVSLRRKGDSIAYGQMVQLQHAKSKRVLSLGRQQAPVKYDGLCLRLESISSDRSDISIHPRFHINTDGEKIETGSQVKIIFRRKQRTLSAAPFTRASPSHNSPAAIFAASKQQEFTDGHQPAHSSLKIHLYARYDANASKYLTANDVVRLHVRNSQSLLTRAFSSKADVQRLKFVQLHKAAGPTTMRSALKASDANVESRAGLDSNSLWIIERDNAAVGGPCKWDDSFRLLHLNSGNFLSTVEGGRAGKVRVVCQTQIRANAALFRLKKLKNNLPNGVKGKPHLIFRNQPFLVCTDLTTANKSKIPSSATTRAESSDATVAANSTKPDAEDELSDADRPDLLDQQLRRRWLSSEDEPAFGDKKSGTGVGEPFRQVSFAVHAIRTQRIQDAMEFQKVDVQEIHDANRGLLISRQLGILATTMKAAHDQNQSSYVPDKIQLFDILKTVEKLIFFVLKTNLSPHTSDEEYATGNTSLNFEESCQTVNNLSRFINFPDLAHQQVLCEQGVLAKVFCILNILTGALKKLKDENLSSTVKRTESGLQRWNKVRKSFVGDANTTLAPTLSVMKMALQESDRHRGKDVQSLCQVLFLAVSAISSCNQKAEISASKWMSFMLQSLLTGLEDLGAEGCLTRMLGHNKHLLHHVVSEKHIKLIVKLLRTKFILKPSYLSLLAALCCVSDGDAVPHQQNRVFNEFIGKDNNLLLRLRLSAGLADGSPSLFRDSATRSQPGDGTNFPGGTGPNREHTIMYDRARRNSINLFNSPSHRSRLEKYDASERQEIEVTWRVNVPEISNQIKNASPRALFPSDGREDGDDWWVPLKVLMRSSQADRSDLDVSENEQLLGKIAEYFLNQLKLLCSLCADRNCLVISAIEKEYTYKLVLAGMADEFLPWTCRKRFAHLMKSLWIDRPPFHPMVLPRRVRVARVRDNPSNSISRLPSPEEKNSEFADFGITNPQQITDNFVVLQFFLISYIKSIGDGSGGGVLSTARKHRAQNTFTSFCISLLSALTGYGFFSTAEQQRALIEPVLNLLDGRNDEVVTNGLVRRISQRSSAEAYHMSSDFGKDIADKLARAVSLEQADSPDLQASSQSIGSAQQDAIVAVKLSAETAETVSPNSARGVVTRIVKSKVYNMSIISAVPFSVLAGVIGVCFTNPNDTVSLINPDWIIHEILVWKFLFWFDLFFICLFILDVVLRAFAMSLQYYLMDCICTLDLLVSILDVAGLILMSYQYMQQQVLPAEVIVVEGIKTRFQDSVETESVNSIKVQLLKLLRSSLAMHLDRMLGKYLSKSRNSTAKLEVFFEVFSPQRTRQRQVHNSTFFHSPPSKVSSTVVPLDNSLGPNLGPKSKRPRNDQLQLLSPEMDAILHDLMMYQMDAILCDLMMYDSKQISSEALQVLVMLHEQASQFIKELRNSQLLADKFSAKMFQSMTKDANILSFALESFEVWSTATDKANVTSHRVLDTIHRLNQKNFQDTTLVLRRGLRRLGLIETIVHEILFIDLAGLNNSWNQQNIATELFVSVDGKQELRNVGDTIFAAVCTFLVSFVHNDHTNKNLIADIPACLDYFSRGLHNIKHTASCCDVLAALLHHNIGLCQSSWASPLIVKVVECLAGPVSDCAEKDLCVIQLWKTVMKLLSLLIQLALCDSVSLDNNQTLMIKLMLHRTRATAGKIKWCTDLKWLQAQKQYFPHTPEAQAAFMQFLRLISICCVSATNNRTRDLCALLFPLPSLLAAYTEHALPRGLQFCICEVIRHLVFVNTYEQISTPIKEIELTTDAIIKWMDSSTRVIQSLLAAEPVTASVAIRVRFRSEDRMRRELFCSLLSDTLETDHTMASDADFMHVAFQVIPITEMMLHVNVAAENRQRFQNSIRAFADKLSDLTMAVIAHDCDGTLLPLSTDPHEHRALVQSLELSTSQDDFRFLEQFDILTLGMFAQQLSLCLLSLISVTTKLEWSDIVPQALESYLYRTMEVSHSNKNVHSIRNQSPHTRCWGIYTSASEGSSCEYTAVQSRETDKKETHKKHLHKRTSSEVCADEAQVLTQEAVISQFLDNERKGVVRAMDKGEHKLPTLLKRMIHIANVQLGQTSRRDQVHSISTITEVIKVVKQYLGEVEREGTETVSKKQHLIVEAGTLELLVRLMSWRELPRKLFLEILDLGCNILAVAGGYREAQKRVHRFLCDSTSQSFFVSMEAQFRFSSEKLLALHTDKRSLRKNSSFGRGTVRRVRADTPVAVGATLPFDTSSSESKHIIEDDDEDENRHSSGVDADPGNRKLLRFWQWLCEGDYQPNKHLLRAQPHNPRSINLLTMAVHLLREIAQRDLGEVGNLLVVTSLNNILCEAVQGACSENQRWLALETELLDTSNNILRQLNVLSTLFRTESRQENSSVIEDLIEDLQQDVVQLLRALLERAVDRSIAEKMCAVIKCEPLLFRMALIRQKVQALQREDNNIVGLVQTGVYIEDEISEARVLGTDILNLILTLAQWAPDWFRRIEVSQTSYPALRADGQDSEASEIVITNRKLMAWFQKDMAAVEIDWNGVHVLHWFFVQGFNLQMTQDEIIASVSANGGDTHINKLTKFMKTCVSIILHFNLMNLVTPHPETAELKFFTSRSSRRRPAGNSARSFSYREHGRMVYNSYASLFLSSVCNLVIGYCLWRQVNRLISQLLYKRATLTITIVNVLEFMVSSKLRDPFDDSFKFVYTLSSYFIRNQLVEQDGLERARKATIGIQIVLFTVHISLLLVAKRALICRDLGEQDPAPGFDVAQEANPLNKCCRRIHKTVFSEHNRVSEAVRRLTSRTLLLLCSIISIWVPFTQALILFDVIIIWPRLNDTAQALASALPKVLSSFVLLLVVVIATAKFEFYYLWMYFENGACDELSSCVWITVQMALTMSFTGTIISHHPKRDRVNWLTADILFISIFVLIIDILLMNIIFGTIIDVFSKLREEKAAAEQQKLNVCYICSVRRQQFEKVSTSQSFDQHKQSRHNLVDYVRFFYYIRTKNANHLTGAEHYVLRLLESYNTCWFPKKTRFFTGRHAESERL